MRTRNAGATTPKTPAASQKKTPPAKKSAAKTPTTATPPATTESTPETPLSAASSLATATPSSEPQVEKAAEATPITKETTSAPKTTTRKVTKRVVKRKVLKPKTPASAKAGSATATATNSDKVDEVKNEESAKDKDEVMANTEEVVMENKDSGKVEELGSEKVEDVAEVQDKGKGKMDVDDAVEAEKAEPVAIVEAEKSAGDVDKDDEPQTEVVGGEKVEPENSQGEPVDSDQKEEKEKSEQKPESMDDEQEEKKEEAAVQLKDDEYDDPVEEDYAEEEGFVEPGEEDLQEEDEDPEPATDEMRGMDEEHRELTAAAKERKNMKEHEIFVGGLDREVEEEDVKKAFEKVGDVVEVRLLKDPLTNKNRGFAFVRFASKDLAKQALSEMKNPIIRGKRCGTAPNEDNDVLFIGNICNTWTKEAIKQKLKEFNIEGVENITLVQDPRHEGLSRGFCFIQFACHADAMFAYKRLQKPDAIFGHAERTAKVAFAEPLQAPDPEVMAKVKSVFIDGLPPHWDEDRVRKHFKCYGEIERITLARNMSSAKRRDFGFVDFTSHEAAIACIGEVNNKELADGNSKTKVRARLSNPMPKTQAVKGGMCGGFRIGRPTGRSSARNAPPRNAPPQNRPNFQYGRSSRGHFNDPVGPYGRRAPYRAPYGPPTDSPMGRPNFGGPRHGVVDRSFGRPAPPRREPFPPEDATYSRPFMGRQYDDPYFYDNGHGLKRPFYMTEQDPTYTEPSRVRPRYDYSDSSRGANYRENYGGSTPSNSLYSSGYYGADYGARPHPSFNGRDRSYGGGSGYYY